MKSRAYDYIMVESSISHIVKQLRVLNAACKENRSPQEWKDLQEKNSMIAYEDLSSDDLPNFEIDQMKPKAETGIVPDNYTPQHEASLAEPLKATEMA